MNEKPVEKELPTVDEVSRNVILNELDLLCKQLAQDIEHNDMTINRYARDIADYPGLENKRKEEEKAGRTPDTLEKLREYYNYYKGKTTGIELALGRIRQLQKDFCFSNDHKRFKLKR